LDDGYISELLANIATQHKIFFPLLRTTHLWRPSTPSTLT